MTAQNVSDGADAASLFARPDTPLSEYSPGNLARLNPQQRGKALKKKRRMPAAASLVTPLAMPESGGAPGG